MAQTDAGAVAFAISLAMENQMLAADAGDSLGTLERERLSVRL